MNLSRPKRLCTSLDQSIVRENEIEQLLFKSDNSNIDYFDSDSEYFADSDSDSSSVLENEDENIAVQNCEVLEPENTNNTWQENETICIILHLINNLNYLYLFLEKENLSIFFSCFMIKTFLNA